MPKFYDELQEVQLQSLTTAQETAVRLARVGGVWWNSDTSRVHVSEGTNAYAIFRNDAKFIVGNSGTASNNVRIYRSGASKLQFVKGDQTTAEGTVNNTSVAEICARAENYTGGGKPSADAANAGRLIFNSTDGSIEYDNGGTWVQIGATSSVGSTDALDVVIDKAYQNKDRGLNELLPNSVADNFVNPNTAFKCYLLEDYTGAAATLKMAVNPVFVNSSDEQTDSATGWSGGNSDTTINAVSATRKIGTNSLSFDKDATAATVNAFIERAVVSRSVYENSNLYFWIQVPSGISGTLSAVFVRLGSSSSNYRQWNATADYAGTTIASSTWHLIKVDVSTGGTPAGSGWTYVENLVYFAVGITTDAAGDLQAAVLVDGIMFADSSGKYAVKGDELTIYNASTRDRFVIDASSTTYNGLITLASSMANSYTAVAATVIKRTTLSAGGDLLASCVDGLSGTIKNTQEVRIRRILPTSISNKDFKAFATFLTGEYFYVTTVNTNVSIVVESGSDVSANWKSGRVVDVAEKVGNGNGGYDYIPRTDLTYTMTGNSSFSGTSLTLPMTSTGTIAVGDLVVKRQVNCYSSVATTTANESFSAMTRDRIEIIDPGIPYFNPSTVWAHWTLSGNTGEINVAPGGGTSSGLDLTVGGTLSRNAVFTKSRFATTGFTDSDRFSIAAASSEQISGDSADSTNFAVSFWFYPAAFTGTSRTMIGRGNVSSNEGWFIDCVAASNVVSFFNDGAANNFGTFNPNAWNHIYAFVSDGVSTVNYLNGVATNQGALTFIDSGDIFYIGRRGGAGTPASSIRIADVVFWRNTTILSEVQVKQIYSNASPNIFGPTSSGFKYRFSQSSQTGQKISLKAEMTREDDTDDPALWAIGLVKT